VEEATKGKGTDLSKVVEKKEPEEKEEEEIEISSEIETSTVGKSSETF